MNEQDIEKARAVSIQSILGIKSTDRRVSVRCVFHTDKSPSLCIYPNNSYHCFGCGAHGKGAIDFIMGLGYDFKDSVSELMDYV